MFCQANKPNIGILQEKKNCYRVTHFITGQLDSLGFFLHVQSERLQKRDYLFKSNVSRVNLSSTKSRKPETIKHPDMQTNQMISKDCPATDLSQ